MFPWLGSLCAAAALAVGMLCSPSFCRAKPPDLPRDITQRCPEGFDGPHAEGFPERPAPPESPHPQVERSPSNASAADSQPPAQTDHPTGAAEEQDAPPEHRWFREPTEDRRVNRPTQPQRRNMDRNSGDDARRQELLRSTVPLDTSPRRPSVQERTRRSEELQLVRYDELLPLEPVEVKKMPYADEAELSSWHAQSTLENIRQYEQWKCARIESLIPTVEAPRVAPVKFRIEAPMGPYTSLPDDCRDEGPIRTFRFLSAARGRVVESSDTASVVQFPCGWYLRNWQWRGNCEWSEVNEADPVRISDVRIDFIGEYSEILSDSYPDTLQVSFGPYDAEMESSRKVRRQAFNHFPLIRYHLDVLSVWRPAECGMLVQGQRRECWRDNWAFLIPSDAASIAPARWMNPDGTIQVYSASPDQVSPLIGPAIMLIVMPTRVEVIRDRECDTVNRIFHGLDIGTSLGSLP